METTVEEFKGITNRADLLELCNTLYHIKQKRKNGFIQVVEKSTGKVVKRTKTGKGAARFVINQLRNIQQKWEEENSKT